MTIERPLLALAGKALLLVALLFLASPAQSQAADLEGVVQVADFFKDFQTDAKAAKEKYNDKRLVLQGEVSRVNIIFDNDPELIFDINAIHSVVCFFPKSATKQLNTLPKEVPVLVSGYLLRAETNTVLLSRCKIIPAP